MNHWSEHFAGLFSDQRSVQQTCLDKISQAEVRTKLDAPPTCEEIQEAISWLKSWKAPGIDGIPAEISTEVMMSCSEDFMTSSPNVGNRELYLRTSKMQTLCPYTRTRERKVRLFKL